MSPINQKLEARSRGPETGNQRSGEKETMSPIRRLISFLKPYRRQCLLALIMLLTAVSMDLTIPRLIETLVDKGITPRDMSVILHTALWMLGASLLNTLLAIGNSFLSVTVSQGFGADVRSALFRRVQSFSFGNLDRLQTGQLLVRLTSDINLTQQMVMLSLRIATRAPLLLIGSVILLVITSPRLAVMMLVLLPLTMAVVALFSTKTRPLFLRVQRRLDRLNTVLQENLAGVRVVKAFVRADHENGRFDRANEDLMDQTIVVRRILSLLGPSLTLFMNLGMAGIVWFGGKLAIRGDLSVGSIMAFVNYLLSTMFPMMMLGTLAMRIPETLASAQRINEVLETAPDIQDQPDAHVLSAPQGRVAMENVSFSYNHGESEIVLRDINLVAEPGQTVAILGATGAGKSSLVNLIPRFYDLQEGRVTIDGVDVRELDQEDLRHHIGMAMQEAVLFSGTIRENIRYGRPEATDEEVIAAAKAAQAHDFIMAMPKGYDTMVEQRGTNLSGGQKQRLSIARALLVKPCILILDDSTSAVDVETEARIEEALDSMPNDCTRFIIAQRISTALNADKIVVLERGKVVAEGTHAELLATSPVYQEIYDSQLGDGRRNHV